MKHPHRSKRAGRRFYASPLLAAGAVAATWIPALRESWAFTPGDFPSWFTGITSHAVHWRTEHLIWSGGAFLVLGLVCEGLSRMRFWSALVLSGIAIPAGLLIVEPGLTAYGGLSGIDSALFGLWCAMEIARATHRGELRRAWLPLVLLAGFGLKIGFELITGSAFFVTDPNMAPVPSAHLVGLACGLLCGLPYARWLVPRFDNLNIDAKEAVYAMEPA